VLITGASSGIGLELAKVFAAHGHALALVARSADTLEGVARQLETRHGIRALAVIADLSAPGAPDQVFDRVTNAGLRVDILVNNAGSGLGGAFAETDLATELRMINLNVTALTHLTKLSLPGMLERGAGRILNVASTAAFAPGPLMAVYYATKAYVLSFSEALAQELSGTGVTVTALCPGPTATGFQSAARIDGARLFRMPWVADAATVARLGFKGLMRGKRIVIPGVLNKLLPLIVRVSPRRLVTRVSRLLQERS
jgi:short-subunit dehydrogenase